MNDDQVVSKLGETRLSALVTQSALSITICPTQTKKFQRAVVYGYDKQPNVGACGDSQASCATQC